MNYRLRNIRTDELVIPSVYEVPEGTPLDRSGPAEWALEVELTDGDWQSSGFHRKTILGVQDPGEFGPMYKLLMELHVEDGTVEP